MSTFIIAEAGVNHNGSLSLAMKMVDAAKSAGADCIKFQTFCAEKLASKYAGKAEYQKENTTEDANQQSMLKKLELSADDFLQIFDYCKQKEIRFLSSAFDLESIDFLSRMHLGCWKIPSGEITNLPYLEKIACFHQPVILSTGMSELTEIEDAVRVLEENGCKEITLLQCTTEYPTPYSQVNLLAMNTLKERFGYPVGLSDHTEGIEVAVAAVAMGACVIEKHFTLDCSLNGPDHKASLEPNDLKSMIKAIRNIEEAIGDGEKRMTETEKKNKSVARKSIVAIRKIVKGEILSSENLCVKRPGDGISPMLWYTILGKPAARDFEEDELIEL